MIVEERQVDAESIELGAIAEAERRDAVRLIAEDAAVSEPRVPVRVGLHAPCGQILRRRHVRAIHDRHAAQRFACDERSHHLTVYRRQIVEPDCGRFAMAERSGERHDDRVAEPHVRELVSRRAAGRRDSPSRQLELLLDEEERRAPFVGREHVARLVDRDADLCTGCRSDAAHENGGHDRRAKKMTAHRILRAAGRVPLPGNAQRAAGQAQISEVRSLKYEVRGLERFQDSIFVSPSYSRASNFVLRTSNFSGHESQPSDRAVFDVGTNHPHLAVTDETPVGEEIVVVRRQRVAGLADRVEEAAVVGG